MTFYRVVLARQGDEEKVLGTVPAVEDLDVWFSGAFANGLLPDPPRYTDEIRVFEVTESDSEDKVQSILKARSVLKFVWRVSWHQFEAKESLILV